VAGDQTPVVGGAPLPKRIPQLPPPPFGVATTPGGQSLFEPRSRGPAKLRPSAALPPVDSTPPSLSASADMEDRARGRAQIAGQWVGSTAAGRSEAADPDSWAGVIAEGPGRDRARRDPPAVDPNLRANPWGIPGAGTDPRADSGRGEPREVPAPPVDGPRVPPQDLPWPPAAGPGPAPRPDLWAALGTARRAEPRDRPAPEDGPPRRDPWALPSHGAGRDEVAGRSTAAADPWAVGSGGAEQGELPRRDVAAASEDAVSDRGPAGAPADGARDVSRTAAGPPAVSGSRDRGEAWDADGARAGREPGDADRRRRALRGDIRTAEGVTVSGKPAEPPAAEPGPPGKDPADAADRVVAGQGADAPPAGRQPDARPYEEDPTEVLGPFDVGMWTLQGGEAGPDPDKVRGRLAARRDAWESRDPVEAGPEARERDLVTVGGSGGSVDRPRQRDGDGPRGGDRIRTVIRGIAQTMITLGLVLLLFAVYDVWFTGILNHRTQDKIKSQLETQWGGQGDDPVIAAQGKPGTKVRSLPLGEGFALIYIPAFGTDYVYSIVEGTTAADLDKGPGHYTDTVLPGQIGNFAVAGHRVGKGSPFLNLDKLRVGSPIVIRTKTYWFTYRLMGDAASKDPTRPGPAGIPGMEIVSPAEIGVIEPVPDRPGAKPVRRLLTLTTCHPKFSARQRLVIHAQLVGPPLPTSKGLPPALKG
jgi:sortase A